MESDPTSWLLLVLSLCLWPRISGSCHVQDCVHKLFLIYKKRYNYFCVPITFTITLGPSRLFWQALYHIVSHVSKYLVFLTISSRTTLLIWNSVIFLEFCFTTWDFEVSQVEDNKLSPNTLFNYFFPAMLAGFCWLSSIYYSCPVIHTDVVASTQ